MKLLYKQEYVERVLFVLEHKGKAIQVYRSSGLSGTGHDGNIIPFSSLQSERPRLRGTDIGYIYKEMFYDGKWISHHKRIGYYPEVWKNMKYLEDFLKDETAEPSLNIESLQTMYGFDYDAFGRYVQDTNKKLKDAIGSMEFYDLKEEF